LCEGLCLDVGSDLCDFDIVDIKEVVAEIKLGEGQGDLESGFVWREMGFMKESDDMFWSAMRGQYWAG
jgi:hypothetical protein